MSVPEIFDRKSLRLKRRRAAKGFRDHDFLIAETAKRLLDRLKDINRSFQSILVIGAHCGLMKSALSDMGFDNVITMDLAAEMRPDVIADEEFLPFAKDSFDCVISHMMLPFVNDVPGVMAQIQYCLKPDGLFLATTLGVETLQNLSEVMMRAELELYNGASSRIGPFVDIVDAAALMQRTGFALPVIDQDIINVSYTSLNKLMHDLRGMGWSSPHKQKPPTVGRVYFEAVEKLIKSKDIDVVFDVLYLTGWAPDASQQKPLRPGQSEHRLADALETKEHKL